MFKITPYSISGLIIILTYLPLFLTIIIKGKTKIAYIYSLHIFSVFMWGIASFLLGSIQDKEIASIIMRLGYIFVLFIPIFFQHSVLLMFNKKFTLYLSFCYLQAFIFSYLVYKKYLMYEVKYVFNSFYFHTGGTTFIFSFILWVLIVSIAHCQLTYYYKEAYPQQRKQIVALGFAITGFLGGLTNFLCAIEQLNLYPFGNFLVPVHSAIVSYAILRHQLFDIKIVIKKSVTYSILITFISISYLIIVVLGEKMIQETFQYRSMSLSVLIAFILGIFFIPLRNNIQRLVDKTLFKGTPQEISEQNILLRKELIEKEKLRSLSIVTTGVAHEIKNPLTAIRTFTEFLPKKLNDKEFLMRFSNLIGYEVNRINDLVNQLLNYAKPSPPSFKPIKIHKLINDTIDILSGKIADKRIHLSKKYSLQDIQLYISVDPNQIRQALMNIIVNAVDAMPNGGALTVKTYLEAPYFVAEVMDTGCGIPENKIKNIFDPFYTSKDSGSGLGLSVTQGIIENHKGRIKVESQENVGTTFKIYLPTGSL